jgi:O-antigen ligase
MTVLIIVTLFILFFSALSWEKPSFAISLIVFALPSYLIRFSLFGLPMTGLEVMILTLFFIWFSQRLIRNELSTVTFSKYRYLIALWLIAGLVAVFVGNATNEAWGIFKSYFVEPILFFLVFINTIKKNHDLKLVINALFASALVVSVICIIQKFTGWNVPPEFWKDGRVTAFYGFPNAVGLYLAPITVLAFGYLWLIIKSWRSTNKLINQSTNQLINQRSVGLSIVVVAGLSAMLFAKSEGALIGSAAGIGLIVVVEMARQVKQAGQARQVRGIKLFFLTTLVLLVPLVSLVLLATQIPQSKQYFSEKLTLNDLSGQIRKQMWKETWMMLNDHREVFGAGLANYQKTIAPYHATGIYIRNNDPDFDKMVKISLEYQQKTWQPIEIYLYPHNIFLNLWSETGLFGLLVFILILIMLFWRYRNVRNPDNKPIYLIFLAVWIHGLVDAPYFKNDLSVLFWVFVAMAVFVQKSKKKVLV